MNRNQRNVFSLILLILLLISSTFVLAAGDLRGDSSAVADAPSTGSDLDQSVYLPVVLAGYDDYLEPIIPDTTKPLSDETIDNLDSISEDGVVFKFSESSPELEDLEEGEIIVGDVSEAAPDGFLRKVTGTSTSGGQVFVETEEATLEEAIEQGEIDYQQTLRPADVKESMLAQGVRLNMAPVAADSARFDYSINTVLYDADGNGGTTYDQVRANGRVLLEMDIDFNVKLPGWKIWKKPKVKFVQTTSELAQLEVSYGAGIQLRKQVEIARHYFPPYTVMVGPVPVVFAPLLVVYVGVDGAVHTSVTTKVDQQATLQYGVQYDDGWKPIRSFDSKFVYKRPQVDASMSVRAYTGTNLSLLIYGALGPYGDLQPYLQLNADVNAAPWWQLYGGLDVNAGVKIDVIGLFTYSYGTNVIGWSWLIAQADSPPPACYLLATYHTGQGSNPVPVPSNSSGCSPGRYYAGEYIQLGGALPASGWTISGWTGTHNDGSTASTNAMTMPHGDASVGVHYSQAVTCYPLSISHTGQGSNPAASPSQSSGCSSGHYVAGEYIQLSGAVPDSGWEIESWSGTNNDSSTSSTNYLTMPARAAAVSVNYAQSVTCYALTIGHTGMGSDPTASPSHSSGCAAGEYVYGEAIQLSGAIPDSGWEIKSWNGTDNDGSTASTNSLTMPHWNKGVMVNYTQICHKLTLTHTGMGTDPVASPNSSEGCSWRRYIEGETIQLSGAVPDSSWEITSWTGTNNNSSTASTNSVTMPGSDKTARVNYSEKTQTEPVTMDRAYTTDCSGHENTTFEPTEKICLKLTATNHTSQNLIVYFYWETWDPHDNSVDYLSYYGHMVDLAPGTADWFLERTIESNAAYGTYEYTAIVEYPTGSDSKTTTFYIGG